MLCNYLHHYCLNCHSQLLNIIIFKLNSPTALWPLNPKYRTILTSSCSVWNMNWQWETEWLSKWARIPASPPGCSCCPTSAPPSLTEPHKWQLQLSSVTCTPKIDRKGFSITKPPLLQRSRLTGGGSPNLVGLVERKSLYRDLWELQIVPIDFIHDCTLVLYKQLIQTGFGCYPSNFTLSWDFLSTRTRILGEPPHTSSIALQ